MYPESRHEMPMASPSAVPSAVWGTGLILDDMPEYQGVHIYAQFAGRRGPDWSDTTSLLPIMPSDSDGITPPSQVQQLYRSVSEPAPPAVYPLCRWAGCNTWLDDTGPAGVKRHLKDIHHINRGDCLRGVRGACRWEIEGGVCGRVMDLSSYGKHIASVHLKSTAKLCEDCGSVMGRADSLTRHRRDHCTVRRDCQYEENCLQHP
ncbi:hypothetical protein DAEQUDRAFT_689247 [Daedalea quercina L-15889]|uniref:C2H2-type domain-containing protein n=1 Tax=Daedalea quercina L-15889 TaxID=1314783 RepID=A0A165RAS3_9APHY|nr:hypothetical protein DAEQUDRAFT_689247 [Daedalea quercina L-15889]